MQSLYLAGNELSVWLVEVSGHRRHLLADFGLYRALPCHVVATILVFPYKRILINFFCLEHQHGCHGLFHTSLTGLSENALLELYGDLLAESACWD